MTVDAALLLAQCRGLVGALEDDLRARCDENPEVDAPLRDEWTAAQAKGRTALTYGTWRDGQLTQVAVAWVLASVFVRFCEDNDLVGTPLLGGPGERLALVRERRSGHFRSNPGDGAREWLLYVFTNAAALPGMAEVLGAHNPLWRLGPSADGARALVEFWERVDVDRGGPVHDLTDPSLDTRFLGDLYQDLSETSRKTFALLQTPRFVESFILDRTLGLALSTFGVEDTDLIDPTCGSGHFLLGAFDRLLPLWEDWCAAHEPTTPRAAIVQRALDKIGGVDLNPFAVAITRFRLLVAAAKAARVRRLAELHDFHVNVAVGDSLLARGAQLTLPGMGGDLGTALAHAGAYDDQAECWALLGREWAAVVGNPPYITVKDPALNTLYRELYKTCRGKYSLGVPFTELFWQLARRGPDRPGYVGMITANSFMKHEMGRDLIERWFPANDVTHVLDTSGAYIPGHGTPTVILFGRNRRPVEPTVRAVMGVRGEPSRPADASQGLVWTSIVGLVDYPGGASEYVSVSDLDRGRLGRHPWSIGGGGAAELKVLLDELGASDLRSRVEAIGFSAILGEDDVLTAPRHVFRRYAAPGDRTRRFVVGEDVRDWTVAPSDRLVTFAFDAEVVAIDPKWITAYVWPWRRALSGGLFFGKTRSERGLHEVDYAIMFPERLRVPLSITFAFVATHNHFVLDRGGKVFNKSAPVAKLAAGASVDDHLQLVGVLNSSTACFWMKQVFHNKGSTVDAAGARQTTVEFENFYEFDGTKLKSFPLPHGSALEHAQDLDRLAQVLVSASPGSVAKRGVPSAAAMEDAAGVSRATRSRMIAVQEELDWHVLHLYGLTNEALTSPLSEVPSLALGERAFEIALARRVAAGEEDTSWFVRHDSAPITLLPDQWPDAYQRLVERRIALIESDLNVGLVERPENKRRWVAEPWDAQVAAGLKAWFLDRLESSSVWPSPALWTVAGLADVVRLDPDMMDVARQLGGQDVDVVNLVGDLVADEAMPFLAAHRYSVDGLRVRAQWEATWELQRAEDRGENTGAIPMPPKYGQKDFARGSYWKLRGKLDVPKERFISYPGLRHGNDTSLVVGWAGWDHAERAAALAAWFVQSQDAGAGEDELMAMLAGLWELVPWLLQWHNDRDPVTGERLGEFYRSFVVNEAAAMGKSTDELVAWRPEAAPRGRRKKQA